MPYIETTTKQGDKAKKFVNYETADSYKLIGAYYPPGEMEAAEGKRPIKKQITCRCPAYSFPHRLDSKACRELYNSGSELTYETYPAHDKYAEYKSEIRSLYK